MTIGTSYNRKLEVLNYTDFLLFELLIIYKFYKDILKRRFYKNEEPNKEW